MGSRAVKLKGGKGKPGRKPKFTNDQIVRIFQLKGQGLTNKEVFVKVSQEFDITIGRSYLTKAAGHYHRLKTLVEERLKNGDQELADLLDKHNLRVQ
jgi:hypothetical protein